MNHDYNDFPEPYNHFAGNIKVDLDLEGVTGIDTSVLVLKQIWLA